MKKSELKALIREVIEEVDSLQGDELSQMVQALQKNPELVAKFNGTNEGVLSKKISLGVLALSLLAAGLTPRAIANPQDDANANVNAAFEKVSNTARNLANNGVTDEKIKEGKILQKKAIEKIREGILSMNFGVLNSETPDGKQNIKKLINAIEKANQLIDSHVKVKGFSKIDANDIYGGLTSQQMKKVSGK